MCVWKYKNILGDEGSPVGKVDTVREHCIAKDAPFSGSGVVFSSICIWIRSLLDVISEALSELYYRLT